MLNFKSHQIFKFYLNTGLNTRLSTPLCAKDRKLSFF